MGGVSSSQMMIIIITSMLYETEFAHVQGGRLQLHTRVVPAVRHNE